MNVGILGLGQVGSAVKQLFEPKYTVLVKEINYDQFKGQQIDYLHVAIPYTNTFTTTVADIAKELNPQLIIIHSTVKPGTSQEIHKKTKLHLIHTPFLGVHPLKPKSEFVHGEGYTLFDYFTRFPKMIGPTSLESGKLAQKHFKSVGLKTEVFNSSMETELAKVLCTTYYGWNIIFEKWVHQVCQEHGVNFDQVYTRYNQYYNQGYQEILPHVVRPILKHHSGPIGGHCVIPNAEIVQNWIGDDFTEFLLKQNKKFTHEASKK